MSTRRWLAVWLLVAGTMSLGAVMSRAADDDKPPPRQNGRGGGDGGPGGRPGGPGGPPGGVHLIPPFAQEKLNLTESQKSQIADLEKECKAKLQKILTPEQYKTLQESRPPRGPRGQGGGPEGGGNGGPREGGKRQGPPGDGGDNPRRQPPKDQ